MDKQAKTKQELDRKSISQKLTYGPQVTGSIDKADGGGIEPPLPAGAMAPGGLFASLREKNEAAKRAVIELEKAKNTADEARKASESAHATQHNVEEDYDKAFTALGRGVDDVAKGNKAIIDKAGMESFFPGKASPVGQLPQVQNLSLSHSDTDYELDAQWDKVKGASSYILEKSIDNPNDWKFAGTSTKSNFTLSNLPTGMKIWVRVAAVGSAGQGAWSDPAVKAV